MFYLREMVTKDPQNVGFGILSLFPKFIEPMEMQTGATYRWSNQVIVEKPIGDQSRP